ncbi:hemerythrin domain-containing protein [Leptospira licerasiae]|uniref:Hemerythrin HHE cation-binding domain protein n=1 Tax=Leptospira licerasiae str. MMD4847 TaxID=1049971 RepID=A0ABN0H5G4_9LEPT|nr:hemerythrin domain-containing protein [Leptospira licerasiae]EIE02896.1 hemerythrin HHE cation-binding domain protein [Leptospira licerasiae serovar Varillal str. VAR 010]EJZ40566.1 hemerythrin HHE cation-binding domain protein [Leptospira licerasiae str. MMD4847]
MQNNRKKVYDFPHKALRYGISKLVQEAGRTNYSDPRDVTQLFELGKEIFQMLKIHARDEEGVSLKHLEEKDPQASLKDKEEHKYLEKKIVELDSLLDRIKKEGEQAPVLAEEFYTKLIRFQTDYFSHMTREEEETQVSLHLYFSDPELDDHQKEIMSSLGGDEFKIWAKYLIPNVPTPIKNRFEEMLKTFT